MISTVRRNRMIALVIRVLLAAVGVGAWFGTQALIGAKPVPTSGIVDRLQLLSAPLNQYLIDTPSVANGLLIVSSALIDLLALFILAQWVFGQSVRPALGLAMVLALRQVVQGLSSLPVPEHMIWHYPGFPSLLVTYSVSNDFFFSAHTAIAVFAATELARLGRRWLTTLAVLIVTFEAATVVVLRAHYTIDVFAAIFTALYVAYLAERISPALDRKVARVLSPP